MKIEIPQRIRQLTTATVSFAGTFVFFSSIFAFSIYSDRSQNARQWICMITHQLFMIRVYVSASECMFERCHRSDGRMARQIGAVEKCSQCNWHQHTSMRARTLRQQIAQLTSSHNSELSRFEYSKRASYQSHDPWEPQKQGLFHVTLISHKRLYENPPTANPVPHMHTLPRRCCGNPNHVKRASKYRTSSSALQRNFSPSLVTTVPLKFYMAELRSVC